MNTKKFTKAIKKPFLLACAIAPILAAPAALAQNPYAKPNGSWISLSGEVTGTKVDAFTLDYGPGIIEVEMDDWDWFDESRNVLKGDKVTVYGRVDDDLYETAKIEADSVFVEGLGTYFFANAVDEENMIYHPVTLNPVVYVGDVVLTGTVDKVEGRKFTVDTGSRQIKIDTTTMKYNPVDDEGFQKIKKGDFVSVAGDLKIDTFDKREILAETVVTLSKSERKKDSNKAPSNDRKPTNTTDKS